MITIRKSDDRGHNSLDWLDTYHTFSFGHYSDPDWMGFSNLRVLNQDRVAPGKGFGTHGHDNMEIVSVVLEGTLEHKDSMGNGSQMKPGDVQLMSAGSGLTHSEFNASQTEPLHFLQMWITPAQRDTPPRYEQREFALKERMKQLRLAASPNGADGSLTIGQDVRLYISSPVPGDAIDHTLDKDRVGWLHVASGDIEINAEHMHGGDGAAIEGGSPFTIEGLVEQCLIVLWDLPA